MPHSLDKTRIVILGGGFGGVYTAHHLERLLGNRRDVEVLLVSRDNYFLMTPLLFEASSGILEPRHAVTPIRAMLDVTRFIEADIEQVDFAGRMIYARHAPDCDAYEIAYDHLVIALGGMTNTGLIPGSEQAMTFKTLSDGIHMRNHVIDVFERADAEPDAVRRQEMLTFVLIGAGLVGIELMGELSEFVGNVARAYPRLRAERPRFLLLEAGPRALPEMAPSLADYAVETLRERGVEIRLATPVQRIDACEVTFGADERVRADTILLATGLAAHPILAAFPLEKDPRGRIDVEPTMRSRSRPEVWALGDCAAIPDPQGKPYPPLAQHALREARVLAENLLAAVEGRPLRPFVYRTKGTLASLGGHTGIALVSGAQLRGPLAWWLWRTYYMSQMPRFERKLRLVIDWTVALFFKHDLVKLDFDPPAGQPRREGTAPPEPRA